MSNSKLSFLAIIFIAIFLRFYNITSVPPSASLDEVSIGYNAYSILKTGADEYGTKFPILLRAYDDFRPALYVYLVIPFIAIFDLGILAVRLPSVILSVSTVIATYFLAKELFPKVKQFPVGELAAFLLAISPWHTYISRLGHEVNAGLAFFVFAALFFLKNRIYFSAICFALSFMSYQAEKIFLPIFLLGFLLIFRRQIFSERKKIVLAALLVVVLLTPFVKASLEPNALVRFEATSIFNAERVRFEAQAKKLANATEEGNIVGQIFYNRRVLAAQIAFENYTSHFSPEWLFQNRGEDRHKVPNLGLFYLWELPLILLGCIFLLSKNVEKNIKLLILLWILISPIPGAITSDAPHAMRTYTMFPMPQLLAGLGILWIFSLLKKDVFRKSLVGLFLLIVFVSIIHLYREYFITFPKTQSASFQYALSKAMPFVLENERFYDKIIFSNKDNLYQSYMFFLFYSKYDPKHYQEEGGTIAGGFAQTHTIGKYKFEPIMPPDSKERTLYVENQDEIIDSIPVLKTIQNLDGREAIVIAGN